MKKKIERIVVLSTEEKNGKVTQIHALEIINKKMTGLYYHAYLSKPKNDYMYYLSNAEYCDDAVQGFINFVGKSRVVTTDKKNNIFENLYVERFDLHENDLKKYNININNCPGIIKCTIIGRYLCDN